jgi:hypothetical protein
VQAADKVNMTIGATNTHVQQAANQPPSAAATRHAEANKVNPPEDTVQLSRTAKAAMGDVDHDGDSH